MNVANYMSSITLDVHAYQAAMECLTEENNSMGRQWEHLRTARIKDIQRFQAALQGSDALFWTLETRRKMSSNKAWLHSAVGEAMEHRRKLKAIVGVKDDDIFQVNVFPLYTLGTYKNGFATR